jgi:hypothetical protein
LSERQEHAFIRTRMHGERHLHLVRFETT